jgi:hypothetical protein
VAERVLTSEYDLIARLRPNHPHLRSQPATARLNGALKDEPWTLLAIVVQLCHCKMDVPRMETHGPYQQPKQFVLCFDGTGNKFAGDASDTNLVKIYRVQAPFLSHLKSPTLIGW